MKTHYGFPNIPNVSVFIWMSLLTSLLIIFTIITTRIRINVDFPIVQKMIMEDVQKGYVLKTIGCKIPDLPITTNDSEKYFKYDYDGAHCNDDKPPLVDSNLTSLFVLETSFHAYNISNASELFCCYEEIIRKIPHGESDKQFEYEDKCHEFQGGTEVSGEFVHVKCRQYEEQIYEDFFAFVPKKVNGPSNSDKMSVLIIGIDAVSRVNFHRQMPKTSSYLKEIEFNEFFGYNKIADNTYPNLVVALSGSNEEIIAKTCRKSNKYYDDCPFIWKNFKNKSYVTSFAEDSAWMGIFNYNKYGFQTQPTDYIYGFFDRIAEDKIGNSKDMNVKQCIGSREGYKMIANYGYDFVTRMKSWNLPYFSLIWSSSLSHDYLNKPRIGDEFYQKLFQKMFNNGLFDNTVVIVMSDHGIRWGAFRQTIQGRIEERLPFIFLRLPNEFTSKYGLATSNLKVNTKRLTTPYDLFETLYDITVPEQLTDKFIWGKYRVSKSKFGKSWFGEIEPTRTCEDSGISDHWCTCLTSTSIGLTPEVTLSAKFIVDYLNSLLSGYAQCAELKLKKINNAQLLSNTESYASPKKSFRDYLISFETEPGGGSFEATVRKMTKNGKMEILGSVSRLNLYGEQSACITDFHLKLYCYCKKLWH